MQCTSCCNSRHHQPTIVKKIAAQFATMQKHNRVLDDVITGLGTCQIRQSMKATSICTSHALTFLTAISQGPHHPMPPWRACLQIPFGEDETSLTRRQPAVSAEIIRAGPWQKRHTCYKL